VLEVEGTLELDSGLIGNQLAYFPYWPKTGMLSRSTALSESRLHAVPGMLILFFLHLGLVSKWEHLTITVQTSHGGSFRHKTQSLEEIEPSIMPIILLIFKVLFRVDVDSWSRAWVQVRMAEH
jgi:hypothetical protein